MREPGDADWSALIARLPLDGYYGVVTTRVLCRFGCPARAPLRRNTRLFDDIAAGEAAGFRRCKRCFKASTAGS